LSAGRRWAIQTCWKQPSIVVGRPIVFDGPIKSFPKFVVRGRNVEPDFWPTVAFHQVEFAAYWIIHHNRQIRKSTNHLFPFKEPPIPNFPSLVPYRLKESNDAPPFRDSRDRRQHRFDRNQFRS
jgi:hypothetical protein